MKIALLSLAILMTGCATKYVTHDELVQALAERDAAIQVLVAAATDVKDRQAAAEGAIPWLHPVNK